MTGSLPIGRAQLLISFALLASACSDGATGDGRDTPTTNSARRAASPEMRAHTGLSHLPEPANVAELSARLDRHYPAQLRARGVAGSTLVDVHVDAAGQVVSVDVIPRPHTGAHPARRAVLQDRNGTRMVEINDRPEFGAAASAALRETRFRPALRDGKPVAHTLRMTVQFDPTAVS